MLGEVVDSLLAEDDVGSGGLDLLDHGPEHVLLLCDEGGDLVGVGDLDLRVDLGLLDLEGGVDQGDLGLLDDLGHGGLNRLLVDDEPFDDVGLVHLGSGLLDGLDVLEVHGVLAVLPLVRDGLHGVDDHVREVLPGSADGLGDHGGLGDELEVRLVVDADLLGDVLEDFLGLVVGEPVPVGDDRGVHVGVDQVGGLLEELSGEDDGGGGAVPDLGVLGLGDLDEHLGGRVLDVHLLEDGHAVVGDDDVSHGVHEHLVHAPGPEAAPDGVGDRLRGGDVVELGVLAPLPFGSFPKNDDRCVSHSHFSSSKCS